MNNRRRPPGGRLLVWPIVSVALLAGGCFDAALLLNPAFVNTFQGGLFPFVPGPENNLLLVRVVNSTNESLQFIVTTERAQLVSDETGVVAETETLELFTIPGDQANEAGVLFDCFPENPITRIGLGRNLNRPDTEPGLLVGGIGDIEQGFGVPPNINPLSRANGDFDCGDTVIFEAFEANSAPGGFRVRAFVLPAATQPTDSVRDTFTVAADFLRDRPTEQ